MLYFDYTATTPIDEEVLDTYLRVEKRFVCEFDFFLDWAKWAIICTKKQAKKLKELLQTPDHNLVFTANATEANNLGIYGVVLKHASGRIITTKLSILPFTKCLKIWKGRGYDAVYLDIDGGHDRLNSWKMRRRIISVLASFCHEVNNIIVQVQPWKTCLMIMNPGIRKRNSMRIGVQGMGRIPETRFLISKELEFIDSGGHKIYAQKGIPAPLLYRRQIDLEKFLHGSLCAFGIKPGKQSASPLPLPYAYCRLKNTCPRPWNVTGTCWKWTATSDRGLAKLDYIVLNSTENAKVRHLVTFSIRGKNGERSSASGKGTNLCFHHGLPPLTKLKKPERAVYFLTNDEGTGDIFDLASACSIWPKTGK